jgi:hypothetical protein
MPLLGWRRRPHPRWHTATHERAQESRNSLLSTAIQAWGYCEHNRGEFTMDCAVTVIGHARWREVKYGEKFEAAPVVEPARRYHA